MKPHRISSFLAVVLMLWLGVAPAWGVSKEMVQLQTQVQQLQEQMTAMQRSFDERMGVMKNLVEQDTDAVNKVANALNALQQTLAKQQTDSGGKTDQLSGQIQALNDTMDELKVRLAKVTKQLEDMQAAQQSLGAQQATNRRSSGRCRRTPRLRTCSTTTPCATTTAARTIWRCRSSPTTSSSIPTPIWRGTAISIWARFSSGRATTSRRRRAMTQVLQNFPSGNKAASAQLKKGFALIELGKQDDGVSELRRVIQRYPHSPEALQARDRLRKLGVATTGR